MRLGGRQGKVICVEDVPAGASASAVVGRPGTAVS